MHTIRLSRACAGWCQFIGAQLAAPAFDLNLRWLHFASTADAL
jgi:hypothetical protein